MKKKTTITHAEILPQEDDGTYTVQYLFDDGSRGVEPGLSEETAQQRVRCIGYEIDTVEIH
jgi:hypothetical protein